MKDLEAVLKRVRDRIGRYRRQTIGERNTKNVLIEPILGAPGWDVEDPGELRREYRSGSVRMTSKSRGGNRPAPVAAPDAGPKDVRMTRRAMPG
jgi:hypothetical protein